MTGIADPTIIVTVAVAVMAVIAALFKFQGAEAKDRAQFRKDLQEERDRAANLHRDCEHQLAQAKLELTQALLKIDSLTRQMTALQADVARLRHQVEGPSQ